MLLFVNDNSGVLFIEGVYAPSILDYTVVCSITLEVEEQIELSFIVTDVIYLPATVAESRELSAIVTDEYTISTNVETEVHKFLDIVEVLVTFPVTVVVEDVVDLQVSIDDGISLEVEMVEVIEVLTTIEDVKEITINIETEVIKTVEVTC